ncbi:hypothetical protein [Halomicronema sp. CCY15110]|uniref:hypothetical protein n=1 Tax=Halomicronema sp. CCY15110 TaxID=2767773 RepID=UPI0019503B68|nr:hypothetical protein [Halomicronema sp. CCY15110]
MFPPVARDRRRRGNWNQAAVTSNSDSLNCPPVRRPVPNRHHPGLGAEGILVIRH